MWEWGSQRWLGMGENEFSLWMNSEGKEKRVRNPEEETVFSPLGPNLFMYAGSFLVGNRSCIYCAGKELFIIVVLLALANFILDDQSYSLQHLVEH